MRAALNYTRKIGKGMLIIFTDHINPIALRKAKIVYNFAASGCSRAKRV